MTVKEQDWTLSERGKVDAARHRQKVKEAIKGSLPDIISDEAIITSKKGTKVKVPVRGMKSYRFRYGLPGGGVGAGQGEGKEGDIIGRRQKKGKAGKAGDQPGIDYLETEIDIEELIEMMCEHLGLPNLRKKEIAETVIPKGWTFDSIEKHGIHLDKKRTIKAAIKRQISFIRELMERTGAPQAACQRALYKAKGDLVKAEEFLRKQGYDGKTEAPRPPAMPKALKKTPFIVEEDLRFRTLKEDIEHHSNAVVIAMMDISGSMGTMKKYLVRSFFFWMVEFLRHIYQNVEIRFIAHTTEAKLVNEHEFFYKGESGGTYCFSAYDLAVQLVDTEYNPQKWNVYAFHFSDGEDFRPDQTVESAKKLMSRGVNMLGYGEINLERTYSPSVLMDVFKEALGLTGVGGADEDDNFEAYQSKDAGTPFLGVVLKDRSHIYPALKVFLRKERRWED